MAEKEKACECIRPIRSFVGNVDRAIIESFSYRIPEAASSLRGAKDLIESLEKCLDVGLAPVKEAIDDAEKSLALSPAVVADHLEAANWRLLAKVRDVCGVY